MLTLDIVYFIENLNSQSMQLTCFDYTIQKVVSTALFWGRPGEIVPRLQNAINATDDGNVDFRSF